MPRQAEDFHELSKLRKIRVRCHQSRASSDGKYCGKTVRVSQFVAELQCGGFGRELLADLNRLYEMCESAERLNGSKHPHPFSQDVKSFAAIDYRNCHRGLASLCLRENSIES